jgi:hypothetical protein
MRTPGYATDACRTVWRSGEPTVSKPSWSRRIYNGIASAHREISVRLLRPVARIVEDEQSTRGWVPRAAQLWLNFCAADSTPGSGDNLPRMTATISAARSATNPQRGLVKRRKESLSRRLSGNGGEPRAVADDRDAGARGNR